MRVRIQMRGPYLQSVGEQMRAETRETVEIILSLNTEEARWLRGVMQSPIAENESVFESQMRARFRECLREATID